MFRRASAMLYCLLLPPAFDSMGGLLVFQLQGLFCLLYALFVWLRLPETRGYDVTEIERILEARFATRDSSTQPPPQPLL